MPQSGKPVRVPDLLLRKEQGQKITMLTAYDAAFAKLLAKSDAIDILLVGDSLGMVQLGYTTTVPVTMDDMVRHTRAVRAGAPDALIVADLPFLSHQVTPAQALSNAGKLIQKGGATAVKIEGGIEVASTVSRIVAAGIPVMGHLGLQPQSVHALGGFRRQARTGDEQERLYAAGLALEQAGAFAVVLEFVPDEVGKELTARLSIPVIGIGAGPHCDGQVVVTHDILGLTLGPVPSFARRFADLGHLARNAVDRFAASVRAPESKPQVVIDLPSLRRTLQGARQGGASLGFVPTMGALHAGHAALLSQARTENDYVAVSIFVNPLQFDRADDLQHYPRTWDADLALCREHHVDLVFAPTSEVLYPNTQQTFVESPALSTHLCGAARPGHFKGVETVVLKLFNAVQPDRAYFGEKDAQQLVIIRTMVRDLNVPVDIIAIPTVRESDGLALSSRNLLLTPEQRAAAPALFVTLCQAAEALSTGSSSVDDIRQTAVEKLNGIEGGRLEYFELADPVSLTPVSKVSGAVLIAVAFWLGATRLIDNVTWQPSIESAVSHK